MDEPYTPFSNISAIQCYLAVYQRLPLLSAARNLPAGASGG